MSERYSKLFSLPENLYAEGAPVIVSAGNLLKDNQTGKVLAQLKIRNIAAKPLKAATVLIRPQDAAGKPMAGDTQQKYLDLTAKTGEEFGQKTAAFLPDASARGFSVEVTQAVFSDNSTWEGTAAPWEPLPAPESLSARLGDAEMLKQFQLKFGGKCDVAPQEHKDLWLCACGAWNRSEKCYACVKGRESLFSLDLDALKAERDARLAKEKAEREAKEAADKAAAEARAKKTKKTLSILIPAVVVCAAALLLTTKVFIPNSNYNKAKALFDAGQYEEAIAAFEALGDYKDSTEQLNTAIAAKAEAERFAREAKAEEERLAKEARIEEEKAEAYAKAENHMAAGEYDEAMTLYRELDDYRDSEEQLTEATYQYAVCLLADGQNSDYWDIQRAQSLLSEISGYKDVDEFLSHFAYRLVCITEYMPTGTKEKWLVYDEQGRDISEGQEYDENGRVVKDNDYTYSYVIEEGRVIEMMETRDLSGQGYHIHYVYLTKYTYDETGKISIAEIWKNNTPYEKQSYSYDNDGKLTTIYSYPYVTKAGEKYYSNYPSCELSFAYNDSGLLFENSYKRHYGGDSRIKSEWDGRKTNVYYDYGYLYFPTA